MVKVKVKPMRCTFPMGVIAACLATPGIAVARDLPQAITDLGLTDIQIREKPNVEYGRRVGGTLPGGSRVEVDLDGNDVIADIEARWDDLFPAADIRGLVPAPVIGNATWPADARPVHIVFEWRARYEIDVRLSHWRELEAQFTAAA